VFTVCVYQEKTGENKKKKSTTVMWWQLYDEQLELCKFSNSHYSIDLSNIAHHLHPHKCMEIDEIVLVHEKWLKHG
jgi:hypothetical protein